MNRVVAMVACGFTLAACSASPVNLTSSPPTQALRIESKPPGAEAKTSLGQSCRTPCELEVQAANEFSLTLALKGYQPQTVSVRKDEADSSKLAPNPIKVELQPEKKRAALKKKPAVAAKQAPAQSASAQPTQPPAPATAAPTAPWPEAAAATNR
jgi:PEGA domain-containing protein